MSDEFDHLNAILDCRFSCRAFLPDPIPRDTIARIITTAQKVPSWCNAQPWHLTVLGGAETDALRDVLARAVAGDSAAPDIPFPTAYEGRYQDRRRTCGWQLYEAVGVEKGDRAGSARQMMQNFTFFGAPHTAIVTTPKALGPYGAVDCGAFVTAFCLAAEALGVQTIPQAAIASYAGAVRDHLGLDADRDVVCAISFGRGDMDHPSNGFRTERAGVDEVAQFRGC